MKIDGKTRVFGLIGDPVAQARTPDIANGVLKSKGRLGEYVLIPMHVAQGDLAGFFDALKVMQNFAGAVVTMPHKQRAAQCIDVLMPEAEAVGAVNAIRREFDGKLVGTMLDGEGFVSGLRSCGHEVRHKKVALFGAGGAGSAIAFALARHGCASLAIVNRTPAKAVSLADQVRSLFPEVDVSTSLPRQEIDIAINATRLGMREADGIPMPEAIVDSSHLVAECVIAPEMTKLLKLARSRGKAIHTGVPMLTAQMELMLRFMSGSDADGIVGYENC